MPTRGQVLIPIVAAAVIVGVIGIISIPSDIRLEASEFPSGTIMVDGTLLEVQVANTEPLRVKGLKFQDQLPYDQGMIFVFDPPRPSAFWMLNVSFPLDMIWFDSEGNAVHIEQDVQPCDTTLEIVTCPRMIYEGEAAHVLEVTAGFVDMFGVSIGSKLELVDGV